jgi:UDP-glucuronate 4-epimerase
MRYLITGTAGFIGFHTARALLSQGHEVTGIDGMIPYYDVNLKKARHDLLASSKSFVRHEVLLEDSGALETIVAASQPEIVIHLAAQAGVRHSLKDPRSYIDCNLVGSADNASPSMS